MKRVLTVAIACGLAASVPAHAQTYSPDQKDARCVLALMGVSETVTGDSQSQLRLGMMYFLGKLMGRHAAEEVRTLMRAMESQMKPAETGGIVQQCGQELIQVGGVLKQ